MTKKLVVVLTAAIVAMFLFFGSANLACANSRLSEQELFLKALRVVESNDDPKVKDGDDGRSIGVYQIMKGYHGDAVEFDKSIHSLKYEDCRDPDLASMIVGAYMRRYELKAWDAQDWETCARLHNGGPNWNRQESKKDQLRYANTTAYWKKVRKALDKLRAVNG